MRLALIFILLLFQLPSATVFAQDKPNIVIVFLDNFGWGEPGFNGGGVIRGAATPRMDKLADEGLRLTNFNVEVQCTPSRSALMTGRYAIRSGNGTVPLGEGVYDRVRAIMDGHIDLEDAEVGFDVENIYAARRYVFGTDRK